MKSGTRLFAGGVLLTLACGGGLPTISGDGYRALLSFSKDERFAIAVRGQSQRVETVVEGAPLIKIVRRDLQKIWQIRPATKRTMESPWKPNDEIAPGYPLSPGFQPQAYAQRFGARIRRIADAAHGLHPCDRWEMNLPSGDIVTLWVARDLEGLVVRLERAKKDSGGEYRPIATSELLDVRSRADPDLFEKPQGYTEVKSYAELLGKN